MNYLNKFNFNKRGINIVKHGFTLIELLVVIAIIGILATIIVASFTSAQQRGRDARRKADLDAIKKALELFKSDTNGGSFYPLGPEGTTPSQLNSSLETNGYISNVPEDPSSATVLYDYGAGLRFGGVCSGGTPTTATCDDYRLTATLENTTDPQVAVSQTRCPHAYGVAPYVATTTYVVCPN